MLKVFLDTNILLDYFGVGCTPENQNDAVQLVRMLWIRETPFLITPTQLKDFHYLLTSLVKRQILQEKNAVSADDAQAVKELSRAALEHLMDVGSIASEGLTDCETARLLMKTHSDYEDNLIAATALRANAHCIVTRNENFAKHCPLACMPPRQAIAFIDSGAWK